jgi:hypothetical protein
MSHGLIHIGRVWRSKQPNGQVSEESINLSQIPETASNEYILTLIDRAVWAQAELGARMEARAAGLSAPPPQPSFPPPAPLIDMSVFGATPDPVEKEHCQRCGSELTDTLCSCYTEEPTKPQSMLEHAAQSIQNATPEPTSPAAPKSASLSEIKQKLADAAELDMSLRGEACVRCKRPLSAANMFTSAGWKEAAISGMCEACFDEVCSDPDDEPSATTPEPASIAPSPEDSIPSVSEPVQESAEEFVIDFEKLSATIEDQQLLTRAAAVFGPPRPGLCTYCGDPFTEAPATVCEGCEKDHASAIAALEERLQERLEKAEGGEGIQSSAATQPADAPSGQSGPSGPTCFRCKERPGTIDLGDDTFACAECIKTWDMGAISEADAARHPIFEIPDDTDAATSVLVLGARIPLPNLEWANEPITMEGTDGRAGQMVALNAGLTEVGYGKGKRHAACLAILEAFSRAAGLPVREELTSVKELTKMEAHILLCWLQNPRPDTIAELKNAIDAMTGQGALV